MCQTTNGEKFCFSETRRTNWLYICGHAHTPSQATPKARRRDETTKSYGYSVSRLLLVPIIPNSFPIRRHYFVSNIYFSDWFVLETFDFYYFRSFAKLIYFMLLFLVYLSEDSSKGKAKNGASKYC